MTASERATYAALSWGMLAFVGALLACWALRPRSPDNGAMMRRYWSFAFKIAVAGGIIVGMLSLALHPSFFWDWSTK